MLYHLLPPHEKHAPFFLVLFFLEGGESSLLTEFFLNEAVHWEGRKAIAMLEPGRGVLAFGAGEGGGARQVGVAARGERRGRRRRQAQLGEFPNKALLGLH